MSLRTQLSEMCRLNYDNLIMYESTAPMYIAPYIRERKVCSFPYEILNVKPDYGLLARSRAVEIIETLHYVYDVRHSHDFEMEDTTAYSTGNTTETTVLVIDYSNIINAIVLVMKLGLWSNGSTSNVRVYVSNDGATWTLIYYANYQSAGAEGIFTPAFANITFRYIRFGLWVNTSGYFAGMRVRKIAIVK